MPLNPLDLRALASWLWSADDLPDLRLFARLLLVLQALVTRWTEGPQGLKRKAQQGMRRWVNNPRISSALLLSRARRKFIPTLLELPEVVVAHDSSEIDEHGRSCPADAGPLRSSNARGYMTHWAVACSLDGALHGALDVYAWTRSWELRKQDHHKRDMADKESCKWDRGIKRAERLLRGGGMRGVCWHAEDKEADVFEHLANQSQAKNRVVVRGDLGRKPTLKVGNKQVGLEEFLSSQRPAATIKRSIDSRVRDKERGLTHQARDVTLELRFGNVVRRAPQRYSKSGCFAQGLPLGVVEVREVGAPEGVEPLHWTLWSTHPVDTLEQALKVIKVYERRWKVEEYFFVCKTGCGLESEHVDSLESFRRLLVVVMVAATHLVQWVSAARSTPQLPAREYVEPESLQAIKEACEFHRISSKRPPRTIGEVVLLLARMGGYEVRKNKPYGWRAVWRGWGRVLQHRAIVEHDRSRRSPRHGRAGGVNSLAKPTCGPS
jgi:hypothetical protein